jgi:hypothetical protein
MMLIRVRVKDAPSDETAIAEAAAYLAYCDRTDTLGPPHRHTIERASTEPVLNGRTIVEFHYEVDVTEPGTSHDGKRLMGELAQMSRVVAVERELKQ